MSDIKINNINALLDKTSFSEHEKKQIVNIYNKNVNAIISINVAKGLKETDQEFIIAIKCFDSKFSMKLSVLVNQMAEIKMLLSYILKKSHYITLEKEEEKVYNAINDGSFNLIEYVFMHADCKRLLDILYAIAYRLGYKEPNINYSDKDNDIKHENPVNKK